MRFDPEKRRRRSIRLKQYNYCQAGAYFVTTCTQNRRLLFGEITDGRMSLNQNGYIVQSCWEQIPQHFKFVETIDFVVMPNHIHGILFIKDLDVVARHAVPLPQKKCEAFAQPVPGSLATIIRSFKSAVTKRINLRTDPPDSSVWQRSFYEHIIRNEKELDHIRQYIQENPLKWELDLENPAVLRTKTVEDWQI